ncbi:Nuclear control of ATPase protein 2 [Entomophthora muscae]|uniref:Nuclear control of ATPase protein 2 n=1 Tax=Entomophthora muscae TaxID=34485 RepID=A0ACC2SJ22_9FUNG|nr:Nuclear control of ATPase protein 2 [Entomophthora muscae]
MVEHKPPNVYSRMLLPSVVGVLAFRVASRMAWENRESILKSILDMKETAAAFFKDWILEPIRDIVKTIRHKDNQISIMSQASIDSELMSLERMVVDFAARKGPGVDLELERNLIRQGSLGTVLEAYESSIKAPLYSALFGDLIQTLLIQGQKTKVDASMALRALDSLLKSNELTFSLIAAIPPILLAWSGYNFLRRLWLERIGKSRDQIYRKARLTIGRIFRILNSQIRDNISSQEHYTNQGFLLCEIHYLRQLIASIQFFSDQDDQEAFIESIRDLESTSLSPQQRLNVIHHISAFYPIPFRLSAE